MFGALNAGLTGTPSMSGFKSKGEALKYAIEFATQWKDGEKTINFTAAEELYKFICKNVELPETFDGGLSSFFKRINETIEEEKRNREKLEKPSGDIQITAEDIRISLANPERIFCDFRRRLDESDFEVKQETDGSDSYREVYTEVCGPVRYSVTLEKEVTDSDLCCMGQ